MLGAGWWVRRPGSPGREPMQTCRGTGGRAQGRRARPSTHPLSSSSLSSSPSGREFWQNHFWTVPSAPLIPVPSFNLPDSDLGLGLSWGLAAVLGREGEQIRTQPVAPGHLALAGPHVLLEGAPPLPPQGLLLLQRLCPGRSVLLAWASSDLHL